MLSDESYIKWAQSQDAVQDDLRAFKAFSKQLLDLKAHVKGSASITEMDIKAEERLVTKWPRWLTQNELNWPVQSRAWIRAGSAESRRGS
jgi:hypothetical protein